MRRILSFMLVLVMVFSLVPAQAFAQETAPVAQADTGDVSIRGTNGFGNLLSAAITAEQAEMESAQEAGYTVTDLKIQGNTATVTYDAMEEAILIVALYTEDGLRMLTSGKTTVSPEETQAMVTIEGTIPEYFMASAYLVDSYDYSPLCEAYETPMYTREMQELLASTIHDYDPDRVLNLDGDENTNFAVFAENTIVIDEREGVNTIVSANDDTMTYIIKNADSDITSLAVGDVFAYPHGDNEILIVKVGSITVDGTTVTILGTELEMGEVFAYAKLETGGTSDDVIVDENSVPEGVTYEGLVPAEGDPGRISPNDAVVGGFEFSTALSFRLEKEFKKEGGGISATISGGVTFSLATNLDYYLSIERQFLRFEVAYVFKVGIEIEGKDKVEIPLVKAAIPTPMFGLYVEITPTFVAEFSAKLEVNFILSGDIGFSIDGNDGFQNLCTAPETDVELSLEGAAFFGVDFKPGVDLGGADLFEFGFSAPVGVELVGTNTGNAYDVTPETTDDSVHSCEDCLQIALNLKIECSLRGSFLKFKYLTFERKIATQKFKLGCIYYSFDQDAWGRGTCPFMDHRITVQVKNENKEVVEGVEVFLDGKESLGTTGSKGAVQTYLPDGIYTFSATVSEELGDREYETVVKVDGSAMKVIVEPSKPHVLSKVVEIIRNLGVELFSGECGEEGSNITWKLYSSGVLHLSGSGRMKFWGIEYEVPWRKYNNLIKRVIIDEGITNIGDCAFSNCQRMTEITIPYTVKEIGLGAFFHCPVERINITDLGTWCQVEMVEGLEEPWNLYLKGIQVTRLRVPSGVKRIGSYALFNSAELAEVILNGNVEVIGDYAFSNCTALTSVTIPKGVTAIGAGAFEKCTNLESASLPDTVTQIGASAFSECRKLASMKIPEGVTRLENKTFYDCDALKDVTLPDTLTEIGEYVFYGSGLTSIRIPASLTSVGKFGFGTNSLKAVEIEDLFAWCRIKFADLGASPVVHAERVTCRGHDIVGISVPADVTVIPPGMFANFTELATLNIQGPVTSIGRNAFENCTSLTKLNLPDTVTEIAPSAFARSGLESIELSGELMTLGVGAFASCEDLKEVKIAAPLTVIETNTFGNCPALTWVTLPDSIAEIKAYAFGNCTALESINLPNGIKTIAEKTFYNCKKLDDVTIPDTVTTIGDYAFYNCDSLSNIKLPQRMEEIGSYAFQFCAGLESIDLPAGLELIDEFAFSKTGLKSIEFSEDLSKYLYLGKGSFSSCGSLTEIKFCSDPPMLTGSSSKAVFENVTAIAYYPESWGDSYQKRYGGNLTWVAYQPEEPSAIVVPTDPAEAEEVSQTVAAEIETAESIPGETKPEMTEAGQDPSSGNAYTVNQIYGGEYISDPTGLRAASFSDLVPGGQYVMIAMVSIDVEDPLSADNLLYVDQMTAGEDGTLTFRYIQRIETDISYVMACGPSNKNLADATITFPEMTADGVLQVVEPMVVYDGETLVEGQDYTILGTVSFTEAGTYTCYIRGIRNYAGIVECNYTVKEAEVTNYVKWYSGTTSLNGAIDLNIYVLLSDDLVNADDTYVRFTYAGKTVDVPMDDALYSPLDTAPNRYRFSTQVYAKQLADSVNVKFMKGNEMIGEELNYSVVQYCENQIKKCKVPEEVALYKAMLNYGAASQQLFNYNTSNLANKSLSDADKVLANVNASAFKHDVSGSEAGIKAKSATLMLEDVVKVRVYFTLTGNKSIDQYTFTIDGKVVTPSQNEKGWYVETDGIAAKDLEKMFTVKVGGITVKYGALSYVNSKVKGSNVLEANISKALFAYWKAAEALLG